MGFAFQWIPYKLHGWSQTECCYYTVCFFLDWQIVVRLYGYGVNIRVFQVHTLEPLHDGSWRWGLWQMTMSSAWCPLPGVCALCEGQERRCSFALVRTPQRKEASQGSKGPSPETDLRECWSWVSRRETQDLDWNLSHPIFVLLSHCLCLSLLLLWVPVCLSLSWGKVSLHSPDC